ncbi:hypothetical protein D5366_10995 [Neokomagataea tanensis]|uniref:Integrase catalytic domain-containing protein n=1 Tax=Neokomagataea tanensis TaxID=661191 RepID=A0A4Y6VBA9_9PROT|nr:hypothetical protein D5366_10995 [Neokomagataea tanensis]
MSRKGNCWDNAVTESFFKTLQTQTAAQAGPWLQKPKNRLCDDQRF